MTTAELIEMLSELPSDMPIYVWFDGDRMEIKAIDLLDGYADINVMML